MANEVRADHRVRTDPQCQQNARMRADTPVRAECDSNLILFAVVHHLMFPVSPCAPLRAPVSPYAPL